MVTMRDIAEKAGVSKTTVSLVLNNRGKNLRVAAKTAERVLREAANLGYRRDEMARAMRTGRTSVFAFLASEFANDHCMRVLDGMMEACAETDYSLKTIKIRSGRRAEDVAVECRKHRFAGVVCYALGDAGFLRELQFLLARSDVPMAIATSDHPIGRGVHVTPDNVQGGRLVFDHLYSLGHREFHVPFIFRDEPWARERVEGIRLAAAERGIDLSGMIDELPGNLETDAPEVIRRMRRERPPTAVIALSDRSALSVVTGLMRAGFKVPEDVSVTGYGDADLGRFLNPALTTVAEPHIEVGNKIVELLLEEMGREEGRKRGFTSEIKEVLEVKLVARDSTAPL